jgi:hypothetical protein
MDTKLQPKYKQSISTLSKLQLWYISHFESIQNMVKTTRSPRSLRNNTIGLATTLSMTRFLSNIVFGFISSGCVPEGCAQKSTGFLVMAMQPSSSQGGQCSLWQGVQVLQMDFA